MVFPEIRVLYGLPIGSVVWQTVSKKGQFCQASVSSVVSNLAVSTFSEMVSMYHYKGLEEGIGGGWGAGKVLRIRQNVKLLKKSIVSQDEEINDLRKCVYCYLF